MTEQKTERKVTNNGLHKQFPCILHKTQPQPLRQRTHSIDRITPHCVVGQLTAEGICGCFTSPSREASCNYGIGKDGKIALCVEEKNRSWCSSSNANDQRAVTIECASDMSRAVCDEQSPSTILLSSSAPTSARETARKSNFEKLKIDCDFYERYTIFVIL